MNLKQREAICELKTLDPEKYIELTEIVDAIDGEIIAVGEATHGTQEFCVFKHQLFRYLVKNRGFRIFAIEAGFPEARSVNDYVVNGRGSAKEVLENLVFWNLQTKELLELVEWIREFNKENEDEIKFYGFDMQFTNTALASVRSKIKEENISLDKDVEKSLTLLEEGKFGNDDADEVSDSLTFLQSLDGINECSYIKRELEILKQAFQYYCAEQSHEIRDRYMAENISWILDKEPTDKIFIWAHNAHISKDTFLDSESRAMGHFLEKEFGKAYYALAQEFENGEFLAKDVRKGNYDDQEIEALSFVDRKTNLSEGLKTISLDSFFINLRDPNIKTFLQNKKELHDVGVQFISENKHLIKRDLIRSFDGLIYFRETSPSELLSIRNSLP